MDNNKNADNHHDDHIAEAHHPSYGVNVLVWIGLISLTAITITIAGVNLGSLALTAALVIAGIKSMFVMNFFMHVKFDQKVFRIFIGVCLVTFMVIFILTFFDLTFRY